MTQVAGLLSGLQTAPDPYPTYEALRRTGRVLWVDEIGRWLVVGHQQALEVLTSDTFSSDRRRAADHTPAGDDRLRSGGLPFVDPPDHTRLRTLVQQAFTPRSVQQLRERVRVLAGQLLDAATAAGPGFDLIADFAGPLPAIVLADLLGIPAEDHALFRAWAMRIIETIDPVSHQLGGPDGARARADLEGYLAGIIAERRLRPRDDLVSRMVAAEAAGDRLTSAELQEMCVLLAVVGLETTTNLIGNGTRALLEHPDQLARLRADPGLARTAIEELLRYDAPVQLSGRVVVRDAELGGRQLHAGETVGVVLGAANRDPEAFADPDRLDLTRTPNNHLSFGRGIHFCLGAPLSRMEGPIAILAAVTRFPGLRPDGAPRWRQNVHVRGFESFPVTTA